MSSTAILGGGMSGLSAAYYLSKSRTGSVKIFESAKRVGGWIQTEHHSKGGFLFEKGPRTIRPVGIKGRNTLRMIEDLNLQDKVVPISRTHVAAKNRMIFANDQLCMLPSSPMSLFRTLPPFTKPLIMAAVHDLSTGRSPIELQDESIYDFAERRFGTETAKYLISSMICGICAGDAKKISVKFLINDIFRMEQEHGGVLRGAFKNMFANKAASTEDGDDECSTLVDRAKNEKWNIYSFCGGLELFPQTLADSVKASGVNIETSGECRTISLQNGEVVLNVGDRQETFQHLISSIPSHRLAPLLQTQHPVLAGELGAIPYVDVGLVNLQYDGGDLLQQQGFGFLVPPIENRPILGVIFDSCCFPSDGKTILTVMMGGAWFQERFGPNPSNKDLFDIATSQVAEILKIKEKPTTGRVHVLSKCIPQYVVGHQDRVHRIREYIAKNNLPLALCGAAYDGVGVNDVIYSAKTAVKALHESKLF